MGISALLTKFSIEIYNRFKPIVNIILINPPPLFHYEKWDKPDYPSITLGYLAASLEKEHIGCKVIDGKLKALTVEQIMDTLGNDSFDIVGITAMTHDIIEAGNIAEKIKQNFTGKTVIIGGVHASAIPEETLQQFPQFDILVKGEGEFALMEIVDALRNKSSLSSVKGIFYRRNSDIVAAPSRPYIENLDELPMPAWHKFPRAKQYQIITARGCPFHCIFCMSPYGHRVRERSWENVIQEIRTVIKQYNPSVYKFNDETFGFNASRAHKILDSIIEEGLTATPKYASMRTDRVNIPILEKMKRAGFTYIDYGIESGNPEILKAIKKGVTLEQTEKAVAMTKQAGIKVGVNVILGHPNETRETAKQTIDYAVKLNGDLTAIGIMVPYPGTEVAEMVRRGEGGYKILSSDWRDFNKQIGNALELKTLSRKKLEAIQALGYLKIYAYNFRIKELANFIWTYRKAGWRFLRKYFAIS